MSLADFSAKWPTKSAEKLVSITTFTVFLVLDFLDTVFAWSVNSWSDCGCESCLSWVSDGDHKLHFVVNEPPIATDENCRGMSSESVVFLHGFLSSSSFWAQTVFPMFSEKVKQNYRLIAVDLLGFGRSPKPRNCSYTLKDHVGMIEKSVVEPLNLSSFHVVAHSMGCLVALALAARYPDRVKSITLVAPPYFPSGGDDASLKALTKLAGKKLWPPSAFGSCLMSWYEHLGRFVCLIFCRNHRIWEKLIKLVTFKRDLHFLTIDLTRHTHHSAWSCMHNVICGGQRFMDRCLEILNEGGVRINVIGGGEDEVVPLESCYNLKLKAAEAEVSIIRNADHRTVILGREKEFAHYLEGVWASQ
ncbi:hypothetical protein K1719_027143 [Acacia pycnantha]|nr:hypothetical protein K1719_027143 [Acacia pycnantha]